MPVVRVGSEKTLAALVARVTKARTSQAASNRVQAAIRAANPGLDVKRLKRGDLIVIPEMTELLQSVENVAATGDLDLVGLVRDQLERWQHATAATDEVAGAERADVSRITRDATVKRAAAKNRALAKTLKSVTAENSAASARAKATGKRRPDRVKRWQDGLDILRSRAL